MQQNSFYHYLTGVSKEIFSLEANMDWISHLATAIAVFRLLLICIGMWIQLRIISKKGIVQDVQRRYFAMAGILYLLGLMPQSLLLLLVSSDLVSYMLDSGYLCIAQKLVCMISVAFHNMIFINWLVEYIRSIDLGSKSYVISFLRHKSFACFSAVYLTVLFSSRAYLMQDEGSKLYTDLASKSDNSSESGWSLTSAELPAQVLRLQLLLCESSLEENQVLSYVFVCYSFIFLPLFLLGTICTLKAFKKSETGSQEILDKPTEGVEECVWWEKEENIQRYLSTFITIWFHFLQPIIFVTHREHFVDFGVHLLLTISVFIPWTLSDKCYNPLQSWA